MGFMVLIVREFEICKRMWLGFFVAIKSDRRMSLEPSNLFAVKDLKFDHTNRRRVHLMGYGWLTVYRYKSKNDDDASYFIGTEQTRATYEVKKYKDIAYQIEKYHRTLK
jgi:hypothetical protein